MATRSASKELKKKAPKKLKDLNAPKAPLTPYLKWGQEQRKKDPAVKSMSVGQQGKILSEMWKAVSEKEKEVLRNEYNKEKEVYQKEFEAYKKTDKYKDWFKQKEALSSQTKTPRKKRTLQSAYNVYFKEQYPIISKQSEGQEKMQMKDVASAIAKQWKSFSDEQKAAYQEKADKVNKERKEAEVMSKEESVSEEVEDEDEVTEEE